MLNFVICNKIIFIISSTCDLSEIGISFSHYFAGRRVVKYSSSSVFTQRCKLAVTSTLLQKTVPHYGFKLALPESPGHKQEKGIKGEMNDKQF